MEIDSDTCHILCENCIDREEKFFLYLFNKKAISYQLSIQPKEVFASSLFYPD
jgi:hypothetical protein